MATITRVETVESSKRRGRPQRKWKDSVRLDMKELGLSEDMTSD